MEETKTQLEPVKKVVRVEGTDPGLERDVDLDSVMDAIDSASESEVDKVSEGEDADRTEPARSDAKNN